MGLGDTVAGLASNTQSGSSLKGFLSKFNSASSTYINQIDPLHTFDVTMYFYPSFIPENGVITEGKNQGIGDKLKNAATGMLDNLTGGLKSASKNDVDILDMRARFAFSGEFGKMSFVDYMARANLLATDGSAYGVQSSSAPQLVLDMSYYVQNITLPQITTGDGDTVETPLGQFTLNGKYVKPTQNTIQFNVINTKAPILERIFYPWMREVSLPIWAYETQPYTTANILISFKKHADFSYMFTGSRPTNIETLQPSNQLSEPTRLVTFTFDHMIVMSDLKTSETVKDKVKDLAVGALNGVGSTLGL